MGRAIQEALVEAPNFSCIGGSSARVPLVADALPQDAVVLDFSSREGNEALGAVVERLPHPVSVVIGSTGLSREQFAHWKKLGERHRILYAPNCSVGILYLSRWLRESGGLLQEGFDFHMEEIHHREKKDAPSGTAKYLAAQLPGVDPTSIVSVRGGGVYGEHTVSFLGPHERVMLRHEAFSRQGFAQGALRFGVWLSTQEYGFYTLDHVHL